ncbi:MAG: hypothetical protein B6D53_01890 [Candidatus Omnitrophica bacterium 4484_49]|nr:MAG: hypothetical protein B6D53_01890 [Candidatus Omnitrophica bacterium 4484_49]
MRKLIYLLIFLEVITVKAEGKVLKSTLAGSWYPGTESGVKKMLYEFFSNVQLKKDFKPLGLIVPHAGYVYSGQTASYGYKLLLGKNIKRVFILGPSHRAYIEKAILTDYDSMQTPLGNVPIDKQVIDELLQEKELFQVDNRVQLYEHSVQIQVPFLQASLKNFILIPIVVGDLDEEKIKRIAKVLKRYLDEETLFIASSDFTHYGYNYGYIPFRDNVEENLKKLDLTACKYIKNLDSKGFLSYVQKTGITICGYVPIAILLNLLPKDCKCEILKYDTSGRILNDFSNSVSYISIAFYREKDVKKVEDPEPEEAEGLTPEEKRQLLKLSRAVLESYIRKRKTPTPEELGIELTPGMKQKRGGFVTLHKDHQLRGCIGEIFPARPLYQVVIDHTIDAAVNDPRFPPVRPEELDKIKIEISALTPPKEVPSYKDIVIGRDGIYMIKGFHRAVFLPQVAPEQGWDLERTLIHLSLKAGLDPYAWREGARFYTFQAEVFSEE